MNILDVEFHSTDLDSIVTIRQYFAECMQSLWSEGESFSGKRPLGNSGWQSEILKAVKAQGFDNGRQRIKEALAELNKGASS